MASENMISIVARFSSNFFKSSEGFGYSRFLVCSPSDDFPDAVKFAEGNSPAKCYIKAGGKDLPSDPNIRKVLVGRWEKDNWAMNNDKQKGRKHVLRLMFRVKAVRPAPIETSEDMVEYLVSLKSPFSEKGARAMVSLYGEQTLEVLRNKPNRVSAELKGYSLRSILVLSEKIRQDYAVEEVTRTLCKYGIPEANAELVVKKFGRDEASEKVDINPYRVSRIRGFSFKEVDEACLKYGFTPSSKQRLSAAILSVADNIKQRYGDVCVPLGEFQSDISSLLLRKGEKPVSGAAIQQALKAEFNRGSIIEQANKVYTQEDYTVEKNLATLISKFVAAPPNRYARDKLSEAIEIRQNDPNEVTLSEKQKKVLYNLTQHLLVLTGGPGSGKTTAAKAIISVAESTYPGINVTCMAPTGKAAGRMKESTGKPASTIHRTLGIEPRGEGRRLTAKRNLDPGLVIIDECSMVDMHLAEALFEAMPTPKDYIVVIIGDVDQLPSIGPGAVLRDLISCGRVPVTMLDVIFRQGKNSSIVKNSAKIKMQDPTLEFDSNETFLLEAVKDSSGGYSPTQDLLVRLYKRALELYGEDEVIVLTPRHYRGSNKHYAGELCSDVMNELLREQLNPPSPGKKEVTVHGRLFRVKDRVIQTNRNNKNINNGEIGVIETIRDLSHEGLPSHEVGIRFDSETVLYSMEDMADVEHGYAVSIHKSQGSEYKCAIIPVLMYDKPLLIRNLIYTALSRAKERAVFVGDPSALVYAITEGNPRERYTLLSARIKGRMKRIDEKRACAKAKAEAVEAEQPKQLTIDENT